MVPTFLTNFALGVLTSIVASIMGLSAWVPGSYIVQGNKFWDSTNNPRPAVYVDTGATLREISRTSSPNLSNSGGLTTYTAWSWQNTNTGTQAILRFAVDAEKYPVSTAELTCTTSPNGTATGEVLFKYKRPITLANGTKVGSGGSIILSGGLIPLVPPNWYIRCWFSATPGPGLNARPFLQTRDFFIP